MPYTNFPGYSQRRYTTNGEVTRIIELARTRRSNPHAALVAELLGVGVEYAASQDLHTRLAILLELNRHLGEEIKRGETQKAFPAYDRNRHINLLGAIKSELGIIADRRQQMTDGERIFSTRIISQIAA